MATVSDPIKLAKDTLKINEIPKCGCKLVFRPLCQHDDPQGCEGPQCVKKKSPFGCKTRQLKGKCPCKAKRCECPNVPGPPCKHILALGEKFSRNLTFDEWQELMEATDPEEYSEPEAPEVAEIALNKAAQIAMMEERADSHRSLRHRNDLKPDDALVDAVSLSAVTRKNGRVPNRLRFAAHGGSTNGSTSHNGDDGEGG